MEKEHYTLVLGAGGNIGRKVARELLQQKAKVGVVGRSRSRLAEFEGKAELLEGDFNDDSFLHRAFLIANSLFLTVPDEAFADVSATARRLARLQEGTPVAHIVNISNSIVRKAGLPTRLVALEQELNAHLPQHLLHLRCGNFFENLNWGLLTPYAPDLKLPYISSFEVAHEAARHLLQEDFSGKQVKALLGERDYCMKELAAAAGVAYQQLPYTPENISFYQPFNEGDFEVEPRTEKYKTGRDARFTLAYFLEHDLQVSQV